MFDGSDKRDTLPHNPDVTRCNGQVKSPDAAGSEFCVVCCDDLAFLRRQERPDYSSRPQLRIADLFCGCGAMSLGAAHAALRHGLGTEVVVAVDTDDKAASVFNANMSGPPVVQDAVENLIDGELGGRMTASEARLRDTVGPVHVLLGGPPCQGHSNLNNHTRFADSRNQLYCRMARAAEVLEPQIIVIENVPAVLNDRHDVVGTTRAALKQIGYPVADDVLELDRLGLPQSRRRHILLGVRGEACAPKQVMGQLAAPVCGHVPRHVSWAIADIEGITHDSSFDRPTSISSTNARRIDWLFDHDEHDLPNDLRPVCHQGEHRYPSMYGRMYWDEPAQTITTGYGSMGQGRFVHPRQRRTITPHEAARLQTLPDFFDFESVSARSGWARLIGNAVPPLLTLRMFEYLIPRLRHEWESSGTLDSDAGRLP